MLQHFSHDAFVFVRAFAESAVKPAEEAFFLFMMPFRNRFEQGGAQGGGQRQGEESREGNRYRHGGGKLGINLAARACKEQ